MDAYPRQLEFPIGVDTDTAKLAELIALKLASRYGVSDAMAFPAAIGVLSEVHKFLKGS